MPAGVQLLIPKGSLTGQAPQLWLTIAWTQKSRTPRGRYMTAIARLKDGVTLGQAQTQINEVEDAFRKQYPEFESGWGVHLVPLRSDLVGGIRPALLVLLGAVAFVLLIACANVANLLLARASGRTREIAVRTALGASRWRIARQSLTESLVLAISGGGLGVLVAVWATVALLLLAPKNLLPVEHVGVDLPVILFTAAVSLLTAVLFGVAPALDATRADLIASMRESGRGMTGARGSRLRNVFAVAEIALSLVLLAGAGLLIRSFVRLPDVDPGFNARNLLTMRIELSGTKYKEDAPDVAFFEQLLERVRALPGVRAASMANAPPMQGPGPATDFTIVGKPAPALGQENITDVRVVDPDYFRALGIPLLRGRTFTLREETVMSHVVVISESLARFYFPNEDPIGQKLVIDMKQPNDPSEIIGVVGDVKHYGPSRSSDSAHSCWEFSPASRCCSPPSESTVSWPMPSASARANLAFAWRWARREETYSGSF
jgi:putative ABC transport system permease protein